VGLRGLCVAILFRNYVYVSGTSPVMVQHLKEYASGAIEMCGGAVHVESS
jgi:hypothetical protein